MVLSKETPEKSNVGLLKQNIKKRVYEEENPKSDKKLKLDKRGIEPRTTPKHFHLFNRSVKVTMLREYYTTKPFALALFQIQGSSVPDGDDGEAIPFIYLP